MINFLVLTKKKKKNFLVAPPFEAETILNIPLS